MVTRDIKLNSVSKVGITNFSILPEVLGATVTFIHDKYEVTIALPTECDDESASVSRTFVDSGELSRVEIGSFIVKVRNKGKVTVPVEMLSSNCNAYELAGQDLTNNLEKRVSEYHSIANEAINVWLRCLRWKRNDWRVGRYNSSVGLYIDVSEVSLVDRESDKKIWGGPLHYTAPGCTAISKECWEATANSLKNNEFSPVHYDLLFDAESHLRNGEIKRALVEAAMAAEILVRTIVESRIPDNINSKIKGHIERVSIRTVFESFLPENLDNSQREILTKDNEKLKNGIIRLFRDRNTIMHSGVIDGLDRELCSCHIKNVKTLFLGLA